jgi:hypothetical protein
VHIWLLKNSNYHKQLLILTGTFTVFEIFIYWAQGYHCIALFLLCMVGSIYYRLYYIAYVSRIENIAGQWRLIDSQDRQFIAMHLKVLWYTQYGMTIKLYSHTGKSKIIVLFSDQFSSLQEHHFRWHLKMFSVVLEGITRKTS